MNKTLLERAEEKFSSHDLVFEGNVISEYLDARLSVGQPRHVYVFQVNRSYKGSADGTIEIQTGISDCAALFLVGQAYLVYAYKFEGGFGTGICSGNGGVETMGLDLRFLRGEPPEEIDLLTSKEYHSRRVANTQKKPGHICGRVTFGAIETPPQHRVLYLWIKDSWFGGVYPIIRKISPDGTFCEEVPPEEYQVSALSFDSPRGVRSAGIYGSAMSLQTAPGIIVRPKEKVTGIDFRLLPEHAATIRGIVKVGNRSPLPDEKITVWLHSFPGDSLQLRRKVRADTNGCFEFQKVPVGFFSLYAAYELSDKLSTGSKNKVASTLRDTPKIQLTIPRILR